MTSITRLTEDVVYGFATSLLARGFDNPQPTPDFHKELWELCCSDHTHVAVAAPRGHAKSTAVTHVYVLAAVLFREHDYVMLVSDTEGQSKEFLNNIAMELKENEELIKFFGVHKFIRDSATDIVVMMKDGHQFRIIAKGSEQKLRGMNWRGKRPNLIIGDDLENDEIVLNDDRRERFRQWFFSALLPAGSDHCKVRIVGTILHLDSLLERLLNDTEWLARRYEAHNDDFSSILWPEKFPRHRLEKIRQIYVNQGYPEGYSQEYRNYPIDQETAYFRQEDLQAATDEDLTLPGEAYLGVDLAISEKDRRAFTAFVVAKRLADGKVVVPEAMRGRWDSTEIIDNLFGMVLKHKITRVIVEADKIEKALGPYIYEEMNRRNVYFDIDVKTPTQDKLQRARPLQAMMRSGNVAFDKTGSWYPDLENEFLTFPKGAYKDQVDALAWVGLTINKIYEGPTIQELADDEWEEEVEESGFLFGDMNPYTGY